MNVWLYDFFVVFIGAIIQGATGFGFALFALPLLTLVLPISEVVPMSVIFSITTNIFVLLDARRNINLMQIRYMIIFGMVGIPIGVLLLKILNPVYLTSFVGVLTLFTAIVQLRGYKYTFKNETASYSIVGFISGVLNGSITLSGPPIVLFLSNKGTNKNEFRGSFAIYALITNIVAIVTMCYVGIMNKTNIISSLQLTPAVIIGVILGVILIRKINENKFRLITLYLIAAIGVWATLSSLNKLIF